MAGKKIGTNTSIDAELNQNKQVSFEEAHLYAKKNDSKHETNNHKSHRNIDGR